MVLDPSSLQHLQHQFISPATAVGQAATSICAAALYRIWATSSVFCFLLISAHHLLYLLMLFSCIIWTLARCSRCMTCDSCISEILFHAADHIISSIPLNQGDLRFRKQTRHWHPVLLSSFCPLVTFITFLILSLSPSFLCRHPLSLIPLPCLSEQWRNDGLTECLSLCGKWTC